MTENKEGPLKLFTVEWPDSSWDTYRGFVIWCRSEEEARNTHPNGITIEEWKEGKVLKCCTWVDYSYRDLLIVTRVKRKPGIVMSDFHNG